MPGTGARWFALWLALCLGGAALIALACGEAGPRCAPLPLTAEAAGQLDEARATVGFEVVRPCSTVPGLRGERAWVDRLPGQPPQPRVHLLVERRGEHVFTLSQTRAEVPFSAIPQGTHPVRVVVERPGAEALRAAGFAGPSGSGPQIAYFRWRRDGVTFEVAATLRPWLTEADLLRLVEAWLQTPARGR